MKFDTSLCYLLLACFLTTACMHRAVEVEVKDVNSLISQKYYSKDFRTSTYFKDKTGEPSTFTLPRCAKPVICGTIVKIDCGYSVIDDNMYFVDNITGEEICSKNLLCENAENNCSLICPPKDWKCS